ncbi:MAG: hypothetical protein ACYSWU_23990 [Planctomycetota bacterium]|jgi:hypothetical protein
MALTEQDFINAVTKVAETAVENNEDQTVDGEQQEAVPELLQPDAGKGSGPRDAFESFTDDAEKRHSDNREGSGGYLDQAFDGFSQNARQTGAELGNLLDNFGPESIVSRATAEAGQTKISAVSIGAFSDELGKISENA